MLVGITAGSAHAGDAKDKNKFYYYPTYKNNDDKDTIGVPLYRSFVGSGSPTAASQLYW